jgi:hypothetical protein
MKACDGEAACWQTRAEAMTRRLNVASRDTYNNGISTEFPLRACAPFGRR